MADLGWLIGLVLLLGLAALVLTSYRSYRRKARISQSRSRAALNQLLAEADELQQRHQHGDAGPSDGGAAPAADD
jgi:type II secretory pathway pseudopilin PulG